MANSCYQVVYYWLGGGFVAATAELEALWWICLELLNRSVAASLRENKSK